MPATVSSTLLRNKLFVIIGKVFQLVSVVLLFIWFAGVISAGYVYYTYFYHFKVASDLSNQELIQLGKKAWGGSFEQFNNHVNFLILGTDQVANRQGDPVLTDTMMILSLDVQNGGIKAVSLPRDLWNVEYKTKINSLYEYGKQRYPDKPEQFPKEVVQSITGVPIQYTIVVSLDNLKELVDILGGVRVDIKQGFVDDKFPRSDVNIRTEKNPDKLYERVEFTTGEELMTGERVLQFARSRHSENLDEGTDTARAQRQQQIIEAIVSTLKESKTLKDGRKMGSIYHWYNSHYQGMLPIEHVLAIIKMIGRQIFQLKLQTKSMSVSNTDSSENKQDDQIVFIHPPISKYGQWVYEIQDQKKFQSQIQQVLGIN